MNGRKLILFANTDWYLYNFRRSLALALRDAGHELLLISPPGPYGDKLRALGLRWEPLPMDRRSLNPLRELLLLNHLRRLCPREWPALAHGTIKCAMAVLGYVLTRREQSIPLHPPSSVICRRWSSGDEAAINVSTFERNRLRELTA